MKRIFSPTPSPTANAAPQPEYPGRPICAIIAAISKKGLQMVKLNLPRPPCLAVLVAGAMSCATALAMSPSIAAADPARQGQSVIVPAQPYPQSGLRQRLLKQGKSIPPRDDSLQFDIPGRYFPPIGSNAGEQTRHPAIVALPDCNDYFPESLISVLQNAGIAVLVISPNQAHPSQAYRSEGSLDAPKHGVTYWAFDALSALHHLSGQPDIDPDHIAVFGYGYGAAAAQLAIYRHGHAKHFKQRFRALIGLRPQCMSEMDNFVPGLLIAIEGDRFNPPAWCQWRMDRDLTKERAPVRLELVKTDETVEKHATRKALRVEKSRQVIGPILEFLAESGFSPKTGKK